MFWKYYWSLYCFNRVYRYPGNYMASDTRSWYLILYDFNSYAWVMSVSGYLTLNGVSVNFNYTISSTQNGYTCEKHFNNICTIQIPLKISLGRQKIHFSLAVLRISPKKSNWSGCKSWKARRNSRKHLCNVERALENILRIRLYLNRYFRIRPSVPMYSYPKRTS